MLNQSDKKTVCDRILVINGGSSSIKFAIYTTGRTPKLFLNGNIERIGSADSKLTFRDSSKNGKNSIALNCTDIRSAVRFLIEWLENKIDFSLIGGIGHRVVFGLNHTNPEIITRELVSEFHRISPYDTDHLPAEIELIEALLDRFSEIPQVACYDTGFHNTMPRAAKILPIPRRFESPGIRRYGFHGLSYSYLIEELARVAGTKAANGRVIIAHLGSGASLAALYKGKSIDTSMGFTPAGGLMMGTRPGDLDPGVAWYMMKLENLTPKQFNKIINHDSGLLGVSETSSDMRDLLNMEKTDGRAEEAVSLFCYQAKKWIGAFAAALDGLETLVFAGGIGENSPVVRSRICNGLEFLGIDINKKQNAANAPVISKDSARTTVRVINTNEELMIARIASKILKFKFDMGYKYENKKNIR
jgi:acetate kinase